MVISVGQMKCFLCSEIANILPTEELATHLFCHNCGEYLITVQAEKVLEFNRNNIEYILSSQTFESYFYEQKPLTIMVEHIENAKDITLVEKLYKLSRYFYHRTKTIGLGSKIEGINSSQFYCKNSEEYFQLLEILKSKNIVAFEKIGDTSGHGPVMYYPPVFSGNAMLAFDDGIENIEDFKRVFMTTKKEGNQYNFNFPDGKNQINVATDEGKISAVQNNTLDITELNALFDNILKMLPQNINDEKRNEVNENLEFIRTEIQSPNPRKTLIKNTLSALKGIASTTSFLASLTKLAEFINTYIIPIL